MPRELILLHPYRLPAHHSLMLNEDDAAIFLNGYLALWHPTALAGASGPPRIASHYDHETPSPGHVYALPESPPLFQPDDWEERVAKAGAICFKASTNREETQTRLLDALIHSSSAAGGEAEARAASNAPERVRLFSAVGLGYAVLNAVFEAMDHLPQLAVEDFWREVTGAVEAAELAACRAHLQAAANRLRETREVLYPNNVYFADLALLEVQPGGAPLPAAMDIGLPINVIASAQHIARLAIDSPQTLERIRAGFGNDHIELCGGAYYEREDALLPIESQLWNLRRGLETYHRLLGQEPRVFARRRFAASPQLPSLLHAAGMYKAVLLQFDDSVVPQYKSAVIEWTAPDGKRMETFTRKPEPADRPNTYFHLAHHLSRTMLHDMTASFVLLHGEKPAASYGGDWLTLHTLAPVFGQHVLLTRFLSEVLAGEYPPSAQADDFHSAYLDDLIARREENPVRRFAEHTRRRRWLEGAWTVGGLYRGMSKQAQTHELFEALAKAEENLEAAAVSLVGSAESARPATSAVGLEDSAHPTGVAAAFQKLADRLLSRAGAEQPGHLLINPCAFVRRVGVELTGVRTPLPAPARATQLEGDKARVVVELPALGFAWVPCSVEPGTKVAVPRGKPVEGNVLRNEFFEAEIDEATGGLRAFRDARRGGNRIAQQLVFAPGSTMRIKELKTTSTGPALGEIVASGEVIDGFHNVLAAFRQRYRCWWGRPLLEIRIDIEPSGPLDGYPWHNCFAARFAWRDEKAFLFRGVNLMRFQTTQTRPESPDYFEIHSVQKGPALLASQQRTVIVTAGLPFLQRQQNRMVDVILVPPGETARTFDLALALDLEDPIQAAQDFTSPVFSLPVTKGPPHVGASGWLFYLDAPNVVLTSLRPAADRDAVIARLVETRGVATQAELHCVRTPLRAALIDEKDNELGEAAVNGDAVSLYLSPGEIQRLRVEFNAHEPRP